MTPNLPLLGPESRSALALIVGVAIAWAEKELLGAGPGLAFTIFAVLLVAIIAAFIMLTVLTT